MPHKFSDYLFCNLNIHSIWGNIRLINLIGKFMYVAISPFFSKISARYRRYFSVKPKFLHYNILQLKIMAVLWTLVAISTSASTMFPFIPLRQQYISSLFKQVDANSFLLAGFTIFEIYSKTSVVLVDSMDGFHILVTVYVATCCMRVVRL